MEVGTYASDVDTLLFSYSGQYGDFWFSRRRGGLVSVLVTLLRGPVVQGFFWQEYWLLLNSRHDYSQATWAWREVPGVMRY